MEDQKEVKKVVKKTLAKKESNFTNFKSLKNEYLKGKMPERKLIAFKLKLKDLWSSGKILKEEKELFLAVLKRERAKGNISMIDAYLLHEYESERCDEICFVSTDDAPYVHHLKKGLECKYERDIEKDRFNVYVPRLVPVEHQLSKEIVIRENKGHPVDASEYPQERVLIRRLHLKPEEFNAWFELSADDILNEGMSENERESYTF